MVEIDSGFVVAGRQSIGLSVSIEIDLVSSGWLILT